MPARRVWSLFKSIVIPSDLGVAERFEIHEFQTAMGTHWHLLSVRRRIIITIRTIRDLFNQLPGQGLDALAMG